MRYIPKVGDVVIIRKPDLTYDELLSTGWVDSMNKYDGAKEVITEEIALSAEFFNNGNVEFHGFLFSTDWIEPVFCDDDIDIQDISFLL